MELRARHCHATTALFLTLTMLFASDSPYTVSMASSFRISSVDCTPVLSTLSTASFVFLRRLISNDAVRFKSTAMSHMQAQHCIKLNTMRHQTKRRSTRR